MIDQNDNQADGISHERLRAVFRSVLEQFVDDLIHGRVEMDAVQATWLRDQRRLQDRVGHWIEKSRNEQQP